MMTPQGEGGGMEWLFSFPAENSQSSSEVEGDGSGQSEWMSANKAPGPDGLPPEFYLTFFDDIAPFILMVFNASQYISVLCLSHGRVESPFLFKRTETKLIQLIRGL